MKKIQSGFTLIELMIVVAIIGILAAIAIPQYQNYVARAQMSEALSLASGGKVALAEYFNTNGEFPETNTKAGMETDTTITGKYVTSVTVGRVVASATGGLGGTPVAAQGILEVLVNQDDAHSKIKGGKMLLTGTAGVGSITWVCSSPATPLPTLTNFLPSSCK